MLENPDRSFGPGPTASGPIFASSSVREAVRKLRLLRVTISRKSLKTLRELLSNQAISMPMP